MNNNIPIFAYGDKNLNNETTGGKQIFVPQLPTNTKFKWVDRYGGGSLDGPIKWGTTTPTGELAHGGVYTNYDDEHIVEYHYAGNPYN
jgi:hypothetical protein